MSVLGKRIKPTAAALRETAKKKRKLVERDIVARVIDRDSPDRAAA